MHGIPKDFVAFDLETTGFAPPSKIIEIGAVKVINHRVVDQYQTFVNPCCVIPANITALTGITQRMTEKAPKIEEALSRFIQFLGDLPLAAHNASFDMKFINYESRRLGIPLPNQIIDTLVLSRKFYPRLENHKLGTVARHIGVINKFEHRGLYDAMVVAEILLKISRDNMIAG